MRDPLDNQCLDEIEVGDIIKVLCIDDYSFRSMEPLIGQHRKVTQIGPGDGIHTQSLKLPSLSLCWRRSSLKLVSKKVL